MRWDVPRGWQARASIMPAPPPAVGMRDVSYMPLKAHCIIQTEVKNKNAPMRFVAAVGGCFEPSFAIVKAVCVCMCVGRSMYVFL